MEIAYEITEDDYKQFNLYHMENSPSHKNLGLTLRYGLSLLCALIIFGAGVGLLQQPPIYWGMIAVAFALVWMVTYPKQQEKIIGKQMDKFLAEGNNAAIFGKKTLRIDSDYIEVIGEYSSEKTRRKSIQKIGVHEDLIFIYLSAITAEIVSTKDIDKNTREELLKLLKKPISNGFL